MRPALSTQRLELRLFEPADAEALHRILGDPASNTIGDGAYASIEQTKAWIERRRATSARTGLVWYAVRLRASGELIGVAGASPNRTGEAEPEVGYLLHVSARGHGYAKEAARAAVTEMLLDRERIWATIRPRNTASIRIIEAVGLRLDHVEQDEKGDLLYFVRDR